MASSGYVPQAKAVDGPWDLAVVGGTALALAGALAPAAGFPGAALGVGLAFAWAVVPTVYVLAVGHVALLALVSPAPPWTAVAVAEGGFAVLVLAGVAFEGAYSDRRSLLARAGALAALFGVTALATLWTGGVLVAAIALSAAAALLVYGLHRYELVSLGLVEA